MSDKDGGQTRHASPKNRQRRVCAVAEEKGVLAGCSVQGVFLWWYKGPATTQKDDTERGLLVEKKKVKIEEEYVESALRRFFACLVCTKLCVAWFGLTLFS
ncbi:uncharacterized protein SPSK_08174 [Sporothrix schenckii 1099-18]|uniref:Uncharacterized protein n=1 Tax=Sporothrix schenckii 1099-18 TaxID=1397361 RepID=A0A0F2MHV0_SPOSC|nr:uncharacterized protein SPSK_08174 [Sporothrix schenckii 1099-18]KJR88629.1 hypothetical protein SPSK_08174 [Sporothrix schenckii 1099-18]